MKGGHIVPNKKKIEKAEKRHERKERIGRTLRIIALKMRDPWNLADKKGFAAEDMALEAAKNFVRTKIIKSAKLCERLSPDDQEGRDLTIELMNGKTIYVQITASYQRTKELEASRNGNYYLAVYPVQNALYDKPMVGRKLLGIILEGYFADLNPGDLKYLIRVIYELKQASVPLKSKTLWPFTQIFQKA